MITTIPEGYREDSQARLVPEATIPDHVLLRDDLVVELVEQAEEAAEGLARLKASLLQRISEHVAIVATQYDADITGRTGDVRLESFDGRMKVERVTSQRTTIGEQIHAAEALVREFLAQESVSASDAMRAIADRTFRKNPKSGELNIARLVDFAAVYIDDPLWKRAQQAIRDSIQAAGTATYFRAYVRDEPDQPWRQVLLDFSSITPAEAEAEETP
jgi:hypothetical protein